MVDATMISFVLPQLGICARPVTGAYFFAPSPTALDELAVEAA
jgi:hypothetical protein